MSAMNGSKSKTNSSKSSTEGGPAPQRFDVAAMVSLAARCRGACWRHARKRGGMYSERSRERGGRCTRRAAVVAPRSGRARRQAASAALAGEPAAAALAQQSCQEAEAVHREIPVLLRAAVDAVRALKAAAV